MGFLVKTDSGLNRSLATDWLHIFGPENLPKPGVFISIMGIVIPAYRCVSFRQDVKHLEVPSTKQVLGW